MSAHTTKLKMARGMMTSWERMVNISPWDSRQWVARRTAIKLRIHKQQVRKFARTHKKPVEEKVEGAVLFNKLIKNIWDKKQ